MNEMLKALKTIDEIASMYAELVKAKNEGVKSVSIDSVLELVELLGFTYAELAAYKAADEKLEKEGTILN